MAAEIISTDPALGGSAPGAEEGLGEDLGNDGLELAAERRAVVVTEALHGERLDKALAQLLPEFSRSWLQQLLQEQCVFAADGQPVRKPSMRVAVGQGYVVELRPTPQAMAFRAEAMPLEIVFEDEHLLVLVKPAGLVVHPAAGHWSGTLLNGLLAHHAAAASLPRAGIVHRLDKDTSGLMLVAKSRPAMDALVRDIAERAVQRRYVALAHGHWRRDSPHTVDQPMGRDPVQRLRMAVLRPDQSGARASQTTFRVVATQADLTLLACQLHTGRTHQIRVHAAWLGHPLVGDTLYGGRPLGALHRQALHAAHLRLAHPLDRRPLGFHAPPPADLAQALLDAGLRYNGHIWEGW